MNTGQRQRELREQLQVTLDEPGILDLAFKSRVLGICFAMCEGARKMGREESNPFQVGYRTCLEDLRNRGVIN